MGSYRLTDEEIARFCLSLHMLVHAGLDPADACVLMAEQTREAPLRALTEGIAASLDEGTGLAQALRASGAFDGQVAAMLHVGELTGRLEEALEALSQYHTRRSQAQSRLRSALFYPAMLMIVLLGVIVVLLTQVLPIFEDVYASLGGSLTGLAGGLLQLGRWLSAGMPALCAVLGLLMAAAAAFALSDRLRERIAGRWEKRYGGRGLSGKLARARFAQTLELGIRSGLAPDEAVSAAGELFAGHGLEGAIRESLVRLDEGASLADALGETGLLPGAQSRLLAVGGAGGRMEAAMGEVVRQMQQEADDGLERCLGMIEPAMVIVCSGLVGAILLSVMLPLTRIMSAIG